MVVIENWIVLYEDKFLPSDFHIVIVLVTFLFN